MLPVIFALCSRSNPSSRLDGDRKNWDDAVLGLAALGKVEFRAGAVGRVMVAPDSLEARLGWSWGCSGGIAAVTSLVPKFWEQIPARIQIPGRDSSALGVSCLRRAFPVSSALGLVLFRALEGLGASKHRPTLRLDSCPRIFGISVPFFLQLHRAGDPSYPPQHNSIIYPTAGSSKGTQIP